MRTTLYYTLAGLLVILLGALSGWYLFLHSRQTSQEAVDTARGLGIEPPTFPSDIGSTASNVQGTTDARGTSTPMLRLWQANHAPVAGLGFETTAANAPADLFYVERGNGYVFDADTSAEKVRRLTNTLLPKIYEAYFAPGEHVLLRSVDGTGALTTFAGTFSATSTSAYTTASSSAQSLSGRYLDPNLTAIAIDQKTGDVFYLAASGGGVAGTRMRWDGSKKTSLFSSPLSHWAPQFSNGTVLLAQEPLDDIPGYAYTAAGSGSGTFLLGPVPGLEILPRPIGGALLYSSSQSGTLTLYAQIGGKAAVALPLATVAEKCVWAPETALIAYCAVPSAATSAHFLNDWLRGIAHTSDTWWQIDVSAGTVEKLYAPKQKLDVQKPVVDPSNNFIAFLNGGDQTLWVLRIAQ